MTTQSRFDKITSIGYNKAQKQFQFFYDAIEGKLLSKKSNLFDIHWSACTEEYANGRKVKLMASKNS